MSAELIEQATDHEYVERAVIGALMHDNNGLQRVEFLKPEMFTGDLHPLIFSAILQQDALHQPFDAVSLAETAGSLDLLVRMQMEVLTTAHLVHHARLVEQAHLRRLVVAAANEVIGMTRQPMPVSELVDRAQEAMMLVASDTGRGFRGIKDILIECVEHLDTRFHNPGSLIGLSTGLIDYDKRIHGLQAQHLYILAGRPSMGKTTLALNIVEHVSQTAPVAVFSLEMPATQLGDKLVCALARVDYDRYLTGKVHDDDWPRLTAAVSKLMDRKILIDDNGSLSITQLRSRVRKLHKRHKLGLVMVDYLQMMSAPADTEGRRHGIDEITRGMKSLAKELEIPVLALSQLNRSVEGRPNKRPVMSDLRESGGIEQDADVVTFIYRDEVYNPDSKDAGTAELITRKMRNGEPGTDRVVFLGHQSRFENFSGYRDQWSGPNG